MRNISTSIENDIKKKFILLSGPRQVGKTYAVREIINKLNGKYYNWDSSEDRQKILSQSFLYDRFVVLDELHKYDRWKNFLKGLYDKHHETLSAIVTGSARLDVYRKGGDSLLGRYYHFHLHPLTVGELHNPGNVNKAERAMLMESCAPDMGLSDQLMRFGGFPEPFYAGNETEHNRWSLHRRELLVREDIRDLTNISLLSLVEHLMLILPGRIGSVLSINSIKEDLQVAHNTVRSWLDTFERLYIIFSLKPFTAKIHRSINKEKKIYLWDWSQISDEGARFENFVASHLWKAVNLWRDLGMGDFDLRFIRDRDRREVDFCVTKNNKAWLLVEAKLSDTKPSENLDYFAGRLNVPAIQLVNKRDINSQQGAVRVMSADRWLTLLP